MHIVGSTPHHIPPYPHCLPIEIVGFKPPFSLHPYFSRPGIPKFWAKPIPEIPEKTGSKGSIVFPSEAFNCSALAMVEVWWKKHGEGESSFVVSGRMQSKTSF